MTTVLIADDHPLVRNALTQLLGTTDDIDVLGAAANGREAVAAALDLSPDVMLMDLEMPELNGIEAARPQGGRLAGERGDPHHLLRPRSYPRRPGRRGTRLSAQGRRARRDHPGRPSRRQGGRPAGAAGGTGDAHRAGGRRGGPSRLSPREQEVLRLVAEGLPNKLIARRLEISEKTVKAHLTSVYASIGVTDRTQAALWAQRHDVGS